MLKAVKSVTALQVLLFSTGVAIGDTGAGILLPWMRNQLFPKSAWNLSLFHSLHFSCAGRMTTPIGSSNYSQCRRRNICLSSSNLGWPIPLELVGTRGGNRSWQRARPCIGAGEKMWASPGCCWAPDQGYLPQLCLCGYWHAPQSGSALLRSAKGNIQWCGFFSQKWVMVHVEHSRYSVWQCAFGIKCNMASSF